MPWVRAPQEAIRLKVTLKGLKPPIWRRLVVEDTMTLGDLHMAVQAAMGWDNSHLHLFLAGEDQIGDPRQLDDVENEARVDKAQGRKTFGYVYDMGDDWDHAIRIERSEPLDPARAYPACMDGTGACPPEDRVTMGLCGDAGGGGRPERRPARRVQGVARRVRSGGVLGRGGGGAGAPLVRAGTGAQTTGQDARVSPRLQGRRDEASPRCASNLPLARHCLAQVRSPERASAEGKGRRAEPSACNPRAPAWRARLSRLPGAGRRARICVPQIREVQAAAAREAPGAGSEGINRAALAAGDEAAYMAAVEKAM